MEGVHTRAQGWTRADLGWIGVVGVLLLLHAVFIALDDRVVCDDVHMFGALPDALRGGGALGLLVERGGWLQLLAGGVLEPTGYSPGVARALLALGALAVPALSALLARRLAGPGAALAAVCLVGAAPMVTAWGRQAWYHVPEAALVLGMALLWTRDPHLLRPWTGAALGSLAALAVALRPSGLLWTLTLLPLALPALRHRWQRLLPVALGWLVAAPIPLASVVPYLGAKLEARERYADMVEPLPEQIGMMVGWALLVLAVAGVALRVRRGRAEPVEWTLALWAALPWAMVALFRAGLDNHTLLVPGLGVLAAVGLARVHRHLPLAALALFLAHHALLHLPGPPLAGIVTPVLRLPIQDYNRPWSQVGTDRLRQLVDASCAGRPRCLIATEQGLFHPFSKGDERFEMTQLGRGEVEVRPVHQLSPRSPEIAALTRVRCAEGSPAWRQLNPGAPPAADQVRRLRRTEEVARWDLSAGCTLVWEVVRPPSAP